MFRHERRRKHETTKILNLFRDFRVFVTFAAERGGSEMTGVDRLTGLLPMNVRVVLLVACLAPAAVIASDPGDWPSHDRDGRGQRFSPLRQITPANVSKLQPAWSFDTGVTGIQVTPLVVGGMMYITAGLDIIALEPETGKVLWKYTAPGNASRCGVAYWPG